MRKSGGGMRRLVLLCLKIGISVALLTWVGSQLSWHDRLMAGDEVLAKGSLELPAGIIPGAMPPLPAHLVDTDGVRHAVAAIDLAAGRELRWGLSSYLAHARKGYLAIALAVLGIPLMVTSVRLWMFMRVVGVGLGLWQVFVATIVGNFFSIVLPGITGGDVPKALLIARDADAKAEGVAMLVADRIVGAFSLVLLGAIAAATHLDDPLLFKPGVTMLVLVGVAIVGAIVYAAGPLRQLFRVEQIMTMLPFSAVVTKMDAAARTVLHHPGAMALGVGLSLVSHASTVVTWTCLVRAFGIETSAATLAVYVPLILVTTTLPISFGGWGVREKLTETFFVPVGVPSEVAIAVSVLYQSLYILWALPGGILLVAGRRRQAGEPRSEG